MNHGKVKDQDDLVVKLRWARWRLSQARLKIERTQNLIAIEIDYINHLKREALTNNLDPLQETTSYE